MVKDLEADKQKALMLSETDKSKITHIDNEEFNTFFVETQSNP